MSNDLKTGFQIKEGYISRRIANLNNKSENLKESRDLEMSKTIRLVLNENTKEEEQLYKEIKKKYIDKSNKNAKTDMEKMWKEEEKELKDVLVKAKKEYGIENEVIEEIFKMLHQQNLLIPFFLEDAINICKASHIKDIEIFKKAKKSIEFLLTLQLQ